MELNPAVQSIAAGAKQLNTLLEKHLGLHQMIEVTYTVDGYRAAITQEDRSAPLWEGEVEPTVLLALLSLAEKIRCAT